MATNPGNIKRHQKSGLKGSPPFPIGFWRFPAEWQGATTVKDWVDAGMTLAMCPAMDSPAQEKRTHAILDEAGRQGVRAILCHPDAYWVSLTANGEKSYRAKFLKAAKKFGNHPAAFGFHVGDEPDAEAFPDACRALRIQKELAPQLKPFCNLLPWNTGCETRLGFDTWSEYLDTYVREGCPDFLCYDCYAQLNPNPENHPWGGLDMYFRNLREYCEAGQRHGIPFWTTLLSVGHFHYRCPTEDLFRWQLNTALAHGAQGILYFFFYMLHPQDNYRVAPIDEHGERSETYEWISRVNRTFLKSTSSVVKELSLRQVCHVGQAWGGVKKYDGTGRAMAVESTTPLIISEFTRTGGGEYLMVVNSSQNSSTWAKISVRGRKPTLLRIGWDARESLAAGGDGWKTTANDAAVTIQPWLAPGQMELYRISEG